MPRPFDPGCCQEPFLTLAGEYPEADGYPLDQSRVEWRPVFHRGRPGEACGQGRPGEASQHHHHGSEGGPRVKPPPTRLSPRATVIPSRATAADLDTA
jgi:hypothetical protein